MALIKCRECGKEISDKAKSCPNCGSPTFFAEEENKDNLKSIAFIVLIIGGVIFGVKYSQFCGRYIPEGYVSKPYLGVIECPIKK